MLTPTDERAAARPAHLAIEGMDCASCAVRVESALAAVPGVRAASVNFATGRARVEFADASGAGAEKIASAVAGAGYRAATDEIDLDISGMSCASCVGRVEAALAAVPGVLAAAVNLATARARVTALAGMVAPEALVAAVRAAGYEALPRTAGEAASDRESRAREREARELRRAVIVAAAFTAPVVVLDMGGHVVPAFHHWLMDTLGRQALFVLLFVLASIVQFGPGLRFYRTGWPALLRAAPDMNSLVMIGTSAAWGYSVVATFVPGLLPEGTAHVYFEASAVIVTLVLAGRYMEALARGRTSLAIRRLMGLRARTARVLRDGGEVEIGIGDVAPGDVVRVRPGETVAVDGEVIEGTSWVDESMITGEPVPAAKEPGSEVIGGTVNRTGSFAFRATRVGADTLLARIVRLVEDAQAAKLPIQALVDRVTAWFVPAVIAAALATFAVWLVLGPQPALAFALVNAVAVLIIACPCAMGLATPTSIMVATGRAAEMGILLRRGDALQRLRDARVVAFDKTGTLTLGRPELTDLVAGNGLDEAEVLRLAAAVERRSEHPVARAIVAAAEARGLALPEPASFAAEPGLGVRAEVDGRAVAVGAGRYVAGLGLDAGAFGAEAQRLAAAGRSPLYVAAGERVVGMLAVADPVKESAAPAVAALRARGLRVVLVTGDGRAAAEAVARQIGIAEVRAEVLPDAKAAAVAELRAQGGNVVFVGDGINDAPALASADVGIAIGTGTDIAIESAEVVLMSGDVRNVDHAIALSRATMRNIAQNLFWAFAYNASLIPVAAGVLYPAFGILLSPVFAAGAMAASSVCVVANALRLRRFRPPARDGEVVLTGVFAGSVAEAER